MPRQENLPPCDTLMTSSQDNNPSDNAQIYATPPAFAKNFIIDSNLSFDDSEDTPNVSLDIVPDLITDPSATNDIYYSYPDHQTITVNSQMLFFLLISDKSKQMYN